MEDEKEAHPFSQKRKNGVETHLSDEQETNLAEWLQQNPFMYNKATRQYRDAVKKRAMWQTKAQ